jgi:hypothetical protein
MANPPSPPFKLPCAWCEYFIVVNARGARGDDPGSGVQAARIMGEHVEGIHGRTWAEYVEADAARHVEADEEKQLRADTPRHDQ